jgi:hypothetical protein
MKMGEETKTRTNAKEVIDEEEQGFETEGESVLLFFEEEKEEGKVRKVVTSKGKERKRERVGEKEEEEEVRKSTYVL